MLDESFRALLEHLDAVPDHSHPDPLVLLLVVVIIVIVAAVDFVVLLSFLRHLVRIHFTTPSVVSSAAVLMAVEVSLGAKKVVVVVIILEKDQKSTIEPFYFLIETVHSFLHRRPTTSFWSWQNLSVSLSVVFVCSLWKSSSFPLFSLLDSCARIFFRKCSHRYTERKKY